MSRHFAVKALMKNYTILIEYFQKQVEEDNDPIANYCLKELQNPQVHVALTVLNEVLAELADLYTVFQRSCIPRFPERFPDGELREWADFRIKQTLITGKLN